jgi:hypothetical protein
MFGVRILNETRTPNIEHRTSNIEVKKNRAPFLGGRVSDYTVEKWKNGPCPGRRRARCARNSSANVGRRGESVRYTAGESV